MKNIHLLIMILVITYQSFAQKQKSTSFTLESNNVETRLNNKWKEGNYYYYYNFIWSKQNKLINKSNFFGYFLKTKNRGDSLYYVNFAFKKQLDTLLLIEKENVYSETLNSLSKQRIWELNNPFALLLLERATVNLINENDPKELNVKTKILKEIGLYSPIIEKQNYGYYSYSIGQKKIIKFISINSGNDLFRIGAILPNNIYKNGKRNIFQQNLDRDYTGSLNIEIGTDYFNFLSRKPVKSYQTISFGFDVYTPSFTDTLIFNKSNSFAVYNGDTVDRPHASFFYIGWNRYKLKTVLSRNLRVSTNLKFGTIGGTIGSIFQSVLHQDISGSLRPKGWLAAISYPGRTGFSLEKFYEYQHNGNGKDQNHENPKLIKFVSMAGYKIGTIKTEAYIGLKFTNKNFLENNSHYINNRIKHEVKSKKQHLMWDISFKSSYVLHNSLYSGYGILSNIEEKETFRDKNGVLIKKDPLTPNSTFRLNDRYIRKWNHNCNMKVSYTTSHITYFYNFYFFSPEVKNFGNRKYNNYGNDIEINLNTRWHRYAQIGINLNFK